MSDSHSVSLGCHAPGCSDGADHLAYDTMAKLNIGFCDDHAENWRHVDHIEFQEAAV